MNAPLKLDNAWARKVCGLPPNYQSDVAVVDANRPHVLKAFIQQPNKLQNTAHLVGLFEYQWTSWSGLVVDCYLEYEAAFDGGDPANPNSQESWPESITLTYALVNGVDVDSLISNSDRDEICAEALGAIKADWSNA